MPTLRTHGVRARAALFLTALAMIATGPGQAAAASSGGWHNLGHGSTATTPPIAGKVETFTNVGSTLYVGGDFINVGGIAAADHIATWNGTSWAALGGGLGNAASAVYAIAVDTVSGKVFAGGSFQNAGSDANADRIAVFNGTTWGSLSGVALNGPVFALAIIGQTLYVGGGFDNVNGMATADGVAAYGIDSGVWSPITDGNGDIGGTVAALVPDGSGGLYVGGNFINANGIALADFVAHWTGGVSWSALGTTAALNNRVRAIALYGSMVLVGGDFTNADGHAAADKVALWTGSEWIPLGTTSFFGDGGNTIYALAEYQGLVFAAGYFNNGGGQARVDGIAVFEGPSSWRNVGTSASGTDGPVSLNTTMLALRVVGKKLYLGGMDSSIGDSAMNGHAAWYRIKQIDGEIATTGAFVGNNIYNATGVSQTRSLTVHRTNSGTFKIKITNDGVASDSFTLQGPGSSGGFTATYRDGATDVTQQVVGNAGVYFVGLAPGAHKTITLTVRVGNGVSVGTSKSWLVTATSPNPGTTKDSVKATVKAS